MNNVNLIGRLTADVELQTTNNGKSVVRFSLAVDRGKDKGADFVPCIAWNNTAVFMHKYLKKGSKIGLSGHIQTGSYTNKENKKVYTVDVIAERVEFCDAKQNDDTFDELQAVEAADLPF